MFLKRLFELTIRIIDKIVHTVLEVHFLFISLTKFTIFNEHISWNNLLKLAHFYYS